MRCSAASRGARPLALMMSHPRLWRGCRPSDATAESYVACYTLQRKAFNKLLGPIEEVWKLEALRKVPILFNLGESKLQELAKRMKAQVVAAEQVIFRTGDPGAALRPCRSAVAQL